MRIDGVGTGAGVAAAADPKNAKLIDAAQQFEGMLLQEMLKPLQSGEGSLTGDESDSEGSAGTLSSLGTESVARAISKAGGLGIANKVIQQVTRESQVRS